MSANSETIDGKETTFHYRKQDGKPVRFLVFGCIHATRACPHAVQAVVDFILKNRPDVVCINGDLYDLEAFMGGARGEGEPVADDIDAGTAIFQRVAAASKKAGATLVMLEGNHEQRLRRYISSSNEVVAIAAQMLLHRLEELVRKAGGIYVPYDGIFQGYRIAGVVLVTHGTIFNQMAPRDMAEMYAKGGVRYVIFNHTHGAGVAIGRRDDAPIGVNAGNLLRRRLMGYAHGRRQTFAWNQAYAYGETDGETAHILLHIHPQELEGKPWRTPRWPF